MDGFIFDGDINDNEQIQIYLFIIKHMKLMKNGNKILIKRISQKIKTKIISLLILKCIGNDLKWNYPLINAIIYNCNTNLYDLFIKYLYRK